MELLTLNGAAGGIIPAATKGGPKERAELFHSTRDWGGRWVIDPLCLGVSSDVHTYFTLWLWFDTMLARKLDCTAQGSGLGVEALIVVRASGLCFRVAKSLRILQVASRMEK